MLRGGRVRVVGCSMKRSYSSGRGVRKGVGWKREGETEKGARETEQVEGKNTVGKVEGQKEEEERNEDEKEQRKRVVERQIQ